MDKKISGIFLFGLSVFMEFTIGISGALSDPLRLKANILVEGDKIRLSQLVEGLDPAFDRPVFQAPEPGGHGTIRTDRIILAAQEFGLDIIETGGLRAVMVSRPGRSVTRVELSELIAQAFVEHGAKGQLDIMLDDQHATRIVDPSQDMTLKVISLLRDAMTGRFTAKVASSGAEASQSWVLTGTVMETREIPIPTADIERGEAVDQRNVQLVRRPTTAIAKDMVASTEELIGMVSRRALRAGEPIRQADLAKPALVEKNQHVTVLFSSKALTISMRGRAETSGAMGETVRVQNPQSKRIIEGLVSGLAQVTILPSPQAMTNLADARGK